jgi:hypothetical protein
VGKIVDKKQQDKETLLRRCAHQCLALAGTQFTGFTGTSRAQKCKKLTLRTTRVFQYITGTKVQILTSVFVLLYQ